MMNKVSVAAGILTVGVVGLSAFFFLQGAAESGAAASASTLPQQDTAGALSHTHAAQSAAGSAAPQVAQLDAELSNPWRSGPGLMAAAGAQGQAAPDPEVIPPQEAERRRKMKQLGYMVPTEYYSKDLRTLRTLAQNGDQWAMVHLGEKYYFELKDARHNPEFDAGMDYAQAARASFQNALLAGNIRSAGIIAETYLQENKRVDAYAWHLLSERLGDSISAEWFKRTASYQALSEQERKQGMQKMQQLLQELNSLSHQRTGKGLGGLPV
ncbi:hypothetical protein V8J88_04285 [Massilia sp. W12]|uniref:hypothetical protein n=1 Tax=Massilia sp. W12 TaxID=3126507 RepID=UPI0030CB406D